MVDKVAGKLYKIVDVDFRKAILILDAELAIKLETIPMENVFDKFDKTPKNLEPTLQQLYEYNRHYMELVKKFQSQIDFVDKLHRDWRQEHTKFYSEDLPAVAEKLQKLPVSEDVRKEWLEALQAHMQKSFETGKNFIDLLTTKTIEDFNAQIKAKVFGGNGL